MKNCKAMVAYRTLNQLCRQHLVRMLPGLFKSLRDERIMLASAKLRTSYTHKRLRQINWILGQGRVVILTAKEFDEQCRVADRILNDGGVE